MMTIPTRSGQPQVARRFNLHNFHDAKLVSVEIQNDGRSSRIDVVLRVWNEADSSDVEIMFLGCTNVAVNLDFDVLKDYLCGQTAYSKAYQSKRMIRRLVLSQKPKLNVRFHPRIRNPQAEKLKDPSGLCVFRIMLFGGSIDIVAKNFRLAKRPGVSSGH